MFDRFEIQIRKVMAVAGYHIHEEYSSQADADVNDVALVSFFFFNIRDRNNNGRVLENTNVEIVNC